MSEAFVRTGVAYGKLGLGTSSELIVGRNLGIETAAKTIKGRASRRSATCSFRARGQLPPHRASRRISPMIRQ